MDQVLRTNIRITPDFKKVIPRFFNTGIERGLQIVTRVQAMSETDAQQILQKVLVEFEGRYHNIQLIFGEHYNRVSHLLENEYDISVEKKALIGAYFTMEYAIEAAAIFNPSVVEAPDQSGITPGEKKVIISFRATGESHISSIVFREGILDKDCKIQLLPPGKFIGEGVLEVESATPKVATMINQPPEDIHARLIDNGYALHFPEQFSLSERVIFPVSMNERNGIEDARFVKFINDDGSIIYYATYTAYDGASIRPKLIETTDFLHFKIAPLHGKGAINKNLALFPKKINGKYVMLSRIDGVNNYVMFSDDLHRWDDAKMIQQPQQAWEFVQMGNCGSPLLTDKGWLMLTHGVGPMRKYCMGASLLDLNDPAIELGRLSYPLLMPNEDERNGYVPNVVYSCGSIIHQGQLFIPYAVSDYASSFASITLDTLLDEILTNGKL